MQAHWNEQLIAQSSNTIVVEGNHYFPSDAVDANFLTASSHTSFCPWKGTAHYYNVIVEGQLNENAAWYYPDPKTAADNIRGYIAFWKGVEISD